MFVAVLLVQCINSMADLGGCYFFLSLLCKIFINIFTDAMFYKNPVAICFDFCIKVLFSFILKQMRKKTFVFTWSELTQNILEGK
jgi:hypothetical protein